MHIFIHTYIHNIHTYITYITYIHSYIHTNVYTYTITHTHTHARGVQPGACQDDSEKRLRAGATNGSEDSPQRATLGAHPTQPLLLS